MTPALHIRKVVLSLTQQGLADALQTTQPTVHRWERDGLFPSDVMPRIRELAKARGIEWSDSWFFDAPEDQPKPKSKIQEAVNN